MPEHSLIHLEDRGVIAVEGPDARKLLQGLLTNDLDLLASKPAIAAALLSPQGKILFEMIAVAGPDGSVLIDTMASSVPALTQRLNMYRLRAAATIRDASDDYRVLVALGDVEPMPEGLAFADPRHAGLGQRILAQNADIADVGGDVADYDARRIALGVPEAGADYALGEAFSHEACLDYFHGISFTKGCFVGQEVASRTENKGLPRKRIVRVEAETALPDDNCDIVAGSATIGKLGSIAGTMGLAMLRLDRYAEAVAAGTIVTAGGVAITAEPQAIARYQAAASARAATT